MRIISLSKRGADSHCFTTNLINNVTAFILIKGRFLGYRNAGFFILSPRKQIE